MADESNKRKRKGYINQEDIYLVLQRYSVKTVLTLLKEVALVADKKIDWNELVKKTTTGISSAREYQMLWRHLAYRDTLEEKIDEGAAPMDDDSDLEFELEAYAPVGSDALTEGSACAKVLIASASLVGANPSSAIEAPLSINIPSGWSSTSASEKPQLQEMNITVPVLVPKQHVSLPTGTSLESLDATEASGGNLPPRRRRKPWSKKEDEELIAAVQRNGEGNWANILKGEFKGDRTPSQLSQRWAIIKKRKDNSSVGVGPVAADVDATRTAFTMAIDMPMDSKSFVLNRKGGTNPNTINNHNSMRLTVGEPTQLQHHHQQDSDSMTLSNSRFMNSVKPSTSPALSPDAMVKAAAFAAGARIATPSDAATLLKAAQSKNAVHIVPSVANSIKSSGPSNINSLPPNVHFIRTGLVNRSTSGPNNLTTNATKPCGTPQGQSQISRPSIPTTQINPTQPVNESTCPKEKVCEEFIVALQNGSIEQVRKSVLHNKAKERAQEDQSALPGSETRPGSGSISVESPRCLSPPKVVGKTDLTGIWAKNQSEKWEEKKVIKMQVEEERENKSIPGKNRSKMENKMTEIAVKEERE